MRIFGFGTDYKERAERAEQELDFLRRNTQSVPAKPKEPRGVVVTRQVLDDRQMIATVIDFYPEGDKWTIYPCDTKEGWLNVFDVNGNGIATFKPPAWLRVESGKPDDIKEQKA